MTETQNKYLWPSKLDVLYGSNGNKKFFQITVPKQFLQDCATSPEQFKDDHQYHRIYISFIQFMIKAMNNSQLGVKNNDFYFKPEGANANDIKLDGENGESYSPKYVMSVEFLAKDIMEMEQFDTSKNNAKNINEILGDDNFAGFRYWFNILDDTFDVMKAIKQQIEENKKLIMRKYMLSFDGVSDKLVDSIMKKKDEKPKKNAEQDQELTNKYKHHWYRGNIFDYRGAISKVQISDPKEYYLNISSYEKFGEVIDFITNSTKCADK